MALLSKRPRVGGLTVVVSGALNRLNMIESTCTAWVGPLAAAVLLPVLAPGVGYTEDKNGRVAGALPVPRHSCALPACPPPSTHPAAASGLKLPVLFSEPCH